MRLLVDARKAFDSGIGTYIRHVLPRVVRLLSGVSVRVLVGTGGSLRHDYLGGCAVEFVEVPEPPLSLGEQRMFRRVLGRNDHFWATSLAHPLFGRIPTVATVHDVAQLALPKALAGGMLVQAAAWLYFRSLRRPGNVLLFNSAFTQKEFHRHVGMAGAVECVTPLCADGAWFDAAGLARGAPEPSLPRPYFVCVGNLRPHKNLRLLIEAFDAVKDRVPHHLVLIGKGTGFRSTDPGVQLALNALGSRARWLGEVQDAELRAWVARADAMVLPSLYEGFGLPALEAMAAGCPVLASRIGAHVEVCGDAVCYFDPNDKLGLSELLLAGSPSAMRAKGLERARMFSWERTASLTAQAITQAIRGGG